MCLLLSWRCDLAIFKVFPAKSIFIESGGNLQIDTTAWSTGIHLLVVCMNFYFKVSAFLYEVQVMP